METNSKLIRRNIFVVGFLGAVAGLLFGLDTGVMSGALKFVALEFNLSDTIQERLMASLMFGAAFGAVFAGIISYRIGRKYSLILSASLFIVGTLFCSLAPNIEILFFGRILLGLAIGVASYAAPLYLAEISPEKIRGSIISMYQLLITIGLFLAFVSDTILSYWEAWRWMLGIVIFPAALMLIGVFVLPRSPRWLISKGRNEEAQKVLEKIRYTKEEVQTEVSDIQKSLKIKQSGWSLFKENSNFRRSVYLGMALQIMQQCTGINIMLYYAPRIIEMAGFSTTEQQMWGSVVIGLTNLLATFIAISFIDKWGRRPLLLLGGVIMAISMAMVGFMLNLNLQSNLAQYFAVSMVLTFIIGFAMSAGPLVWTLCSEIQPLKGRDFGITVSTGTNWLMNMILAATFLSLINALGSSNTFWFYAVLNALSIIFVYYFVPETKEISLEKIESNLMAGKKLRDIGQH